MIVNTTRIIVRPEKRKELCQTISSLLDPVRNDSGCLAYRFYQEEGHENAFILIGEWRSQSDWERYLESDDFSVLLGTISVLGSQPDTDFKLLAPVASLELITKLRMH